MSVSPPEVIDEVPDDLVGSSTPCAFIETLRTARQVAARLVHAVESGGSFSLQADVFSKGDKYMVDIVAHSSNSAISAEQFSDLARLSYLKGIQGWSAGRTREGGTYIRVTVDGADISPQYSRKPIDDMEMTRGFV
ncbi:hypothetical protein BJF79_05740 [Actinomadura sp. CNU-125]|nr:hypothetical protein BJF79_05740 [Actinomadura sp. CNU-125]